MTTELSPALVEALVIGQLPDVRWKAQDDLCDCVYQRVSFHTNPYLAETLEVRLCCLMGELYKQYPQFVRLVPAFMDYGHDDEWVTEPAKWNGEQDMPLALWHRQLARTRNITVAEARALNLPAPKGKPRKPLPHLFLRAGGEWCELELI